MKLNFADKLFALVIVITIIYGVVERQLQSSETPPATEQMWETIE